MIRDETRGGKGRRFGDARARICLAALVAGMSLAWPQEVAKAQGVVRADRVRVGSEEERYLRALSVVTPTSTDSGAASSRIHSWLVRPLAGEGAARALVGIDGPWAIDTTVQANGIALNGADIVLAVNSALPTSGIDGPAWSGRGANLRATGTLLARRGRLLVRVAPMPWIAQNAAFDLVPTTGPFPWSDAARPNSIDLPQRFGDAPVSRIDPGESTIEYRWSKVRLALTSAAVQLGPGTDHSLLMQGNAGGIPRLELGTPAAFVTPIGRFTGHVAWGRTPSTAWAPERRTGARFTSYIVGTWQPSFARQLEFGMTRLNHRDWELITARELLVPFGSVYSADWVGGDYDSSKDNQLASVYTRFRVPDAGLEFFAEYGKNDRSIDWRDQLVELEHNSAWLVGGQKAWRDGRRLWALNVTVVSGAIVPVARFRGQAFFYEHFPLTQGHTLRGQLLGTPLLQREGGTEIRLDRYDPRGRTGLTLTTRTLPNQLAESVAPELLRQEWSLMFDVLRWTRAGAWTGRIGGVADLGYSPTTGDAYNAHVAVGYIWR